jgi:tetratricopeptide (TPR) repeat protein
MENAKSDENEPLKPSPSPAAQAPAQKPNIEETQPARIEFESPSANQDLSETTATPIASQTPPSPENADVSDTLAGMSVQKGHEATGPVLLEPVPPRPELFADQPPPPIRRPGAAKRPRSKGLPWFFFPLSGLAILLLVFVLSGFGGYASGIGLRKSAEMTQSAHAVAEQFQLGLQDMEQGAYARARQRFEYVIQLDPNYPGVTEKLADVLLALNTTATPTLLPTQTVTPTPDTRDNEQLFDQAQQALAGSDWTTAIDELLALRKTDAAFRAVEVDGMLFLALRNRGRDKILKESDLEAGIYDLTLAAKFGPLDAEAQGLLNWSGLYITGASFWGIDWEQAVSYFSQVAPQLPNLMDGSRMTATERLRIALFEYGNVLAGNGQFCRAVKAYQDSLAIAPDPKVQQAGELAVKGCEGGGAEPQGTPKPNKKPKPTVVIP